MEFNQSREPWNEGKLLGQKPSSEKSLHSRLSRLRLPLNIIVSVLSLHVRTANPMALITNQAVTANSHVLRLSTYGPVGPLNNC